MQYELIELLDLPSPDQLGNYGLLRERLHYHPDDVSAADKQAFCRLILGQCPGAINVDDIDLVESTAGRVAAMYQQWGHPEQRDLKRKNYWHKAGEAPIRNAFLPLEFSLERRKEFDTLRAIVRPWLAKFAPLTCPPTPQISLPGSTTSPGTVFAV
jgi:hypothetical protein